MSSRIQTYIGTKRQRITLLAFVLFAVSFTTLLVWVFQSFNLSLFINRQETTPIETTFSTFSASSSSPVQLSIPSVNITASFETPLGLTERGTVAVPEAYTTVGWYKYGPTPGALGPSVILGHVDSVDGPAVFFSLGQVNVGDEVLIEREDGSTVIFEITHLERIRQGDFPTQKVYGNTPYAGIRLITCTGTYDKGVQRYSHNLIVYGTLKEIQHSDGTIETDTPS